MLEKLYKEDFDKVYALMQESFPDDEYRPRHKQRGLLERAEYSIRVVYGEDRSVRAFLASWQFPTFLYVEHFAVSPTQRNNGLGAAVLAELCESAPCGVCLEVEPPETELARRRIRFYERNRFVLNDEYRYVQPPMSEGKRPLPLQLMTYGERKEVRALEEMKRTLYERVYGVPADAEF